MERDEAGDKVFPGSLAAIRPVWDRVDELLTERSLQRDVKTIYVSYTDDHNNLVAAAHPDPTTTTLELALALPPDFGGFTYDVSHLKWRTLPIGLRLAYPNDVTNEVKRIIDEAVAYAPHSKPQPIDQFYRHRRRGRTSLGEG